MSPDSRFFFPQMLLKRASADAQDEFADLKLGLPKQIAFGSADQKPRQIGDLLIDRRPNLVLKQFRLSFLFLTKLIASDHDVSL